MDTLNLHVRMNRDAVLDRRAFLETTALGVGGLTALGWTDAVRGAASDLRKEGLACILLFLQGGPSQFETFDPKQGTRTGGETKAVDTAVKGVQIAENWPKVAAQLKDIALVRSMTGREGNHQRAQFLLHTGFAPSGGVKYPNFGSVAVLPPAEG
jgi:hypothetical protein